MIPCIAVSSAPDPFQTPAARVVDDAALASLQQKLREHPLSFGELFSLAWWALREQMGTFAAILILFYAPNIAFTVLGEQAIKGAGLGAIFLFSLGASCLALLVTTSIAVATAGILEGRPLSTGAVIKRTFAKFFPALAVTWVAALICGLWTMLLIIPGLWAFVRYSFVGYAVVIHDAGIRAALARTKHLVDNTWWATFALYGGASGWALVAKWVVDAIQTRTGMPIFVELIARTSLSGITLFFMIVLTAMYLNRHYTRPLAPG